MKTEMLDAAVEEETDGDEALEAFKDMAKAIRDGDDEAAYQAFKDALELA